MQLTENMFIERLGSKSGCGLRMRCRAIECFDSEEITCSVSGLLSGLYLLLFTDCLISRYWIWQVYLFAVIVPLLCQLTPAPLPAKDCPENPARRTRSISPIVLLIRAPASRFPYLLERYGPFKPLAF